MTFNTDIDVAQYIKSLGGDLWLVGGAVRDEIMQRPLKDRDYMITGIDIDCIPFEKVAGKRFPVFLVKIGDITCEVAMARTERKDGHGRQEFEFFTSKLVTVVQDMARRDVTMNAMAKHVLSGQLIDPFHGKDDIERKILRHTTEAFSEEPSRVYRVARFAAQFGFDVHPQTMMCMHDLRYEVPFLSPEIVWQETLKALETPAPQRYFEILNRVECLHQFFPELQALHVEDKHDGTAFKHTMTVLPHGKNLLQRFGLLVHDFGKGRTPVEKHPSHSDHDQLGVELVNEMCDRLRIPNSYRDFGIACAREHMRVKRALQMRPGTFLRWVLQNERIIKQLNEVSYIDSAYREEGDVKRSQAFRCQVNRRINAALRTKKDMTGEMLIAEGYTPGKVFGDILFQRRVEMFKQLCECG
jgi:tRNA nucleotidyltransferase (CCA-adding enzyme)